MKSKYEAPLFQEIQADEFNLILMESYGNKDSCYT